ncbi:MAG: ankyrin repeat domain-containing protein [Burkholderiaceae bacterium]
MNLFRTGLLSLLLFTTLGVAARAESPTVQAWFDALKKDDVWALSSMQMKGISTNLTDDDGNTALHGAIALGKLDTLKWLLNQPDIAINQRNKANETALMFAAIRCDLSAAKALIERGAAINHTGWVPLHYAASCRASNATDLVHLMLEHHAYIDAESPNGSTPLMLAAQYGRFETVRLLVEAGADVAIRNQRDLTAVDFAALRDNPDVKQYLHEALLDKKRLKKGTW